MSARTVLGTSIGPWIAVALLAAGCGGVDDSIATSDSAPVTLGELDDVVLTVAPDDFAGEPVRLEDIDDDGEVEIVEAEATDVDVSAEDAVTRIEESIDSGDDATEDDAEDDGLNPLGGDDPEDKRMPDVVCMGLQDAQNEIQDRGVFFSKSEDATGDGRRQLWDRNWIVVSQDPEPGVPIGEREAVLYVVKKDEDNDC
ncbi:MAG: hypothetical protein WA964_00255 [Ilumatobacter sp.]|uniref:hypothetical protein n=1 Tax=Ilumatobacter sp. TaxID=1967498 RepID=UPI003C78C35E